MTCLFRTDLRTSLVLRETGVPTLVAAGDVFIAKPKVPAVSSHCYLELHDREGPPQEGQGIPVHVNLDRSSLLGCCVIPSRKLSAIGYDTTGDGFVDSLDTDGDGFLDKDVSVVNLHEDEVPAIRDEDAGSQAREIFDTIDFDGSGSISKMDLLGAMKRNKCVDDFVLPGSDAKTFSDESEEALQSVDLLFATISGGASRIDKDAFVAHFEKKVKDVAQEEVAKIQAQMDERQAAAQEELTKAKIELERLQAEVASGQAVQSEVSSMNKEIARLQTIIAELAKQKSELQATAKDEITKLQTSMGAQQAAAQEELSKAKKELERLQAELSSEVVDARSQVASLSQEVERHQAAIKSFSQQRAELQATAQTEIARLQASMEQQQAAAQEELAEAKEELQRLQAKNADSAKFQASMREREAAVQEELSKAKAEIERHRKELSSKLTQKEQQLVVAQKEMTSLKDDMKKMQASIAAEDEIVRLEAALKQQKTLSKYEVLAALQKLPAARALLMPSCNSQLALSEDVWNKVDAFFESAAGGRQRISFQDFATFYHIRMALSTGHKKVDRTTKNVLIIGPGFGRELNPKQSAMVMNAGFRTRFVLDIPNPETPGFRMDVHLGKLVQALRQSPPDLIVCASKGWPYVVALWNLWQSGTISQFATLMINVHPSITTLPKTKNVIIAHGSNDTIYSRTRQSLETLVSTSDCNKCFLYWSANSGQINGGYSRYGDKHDMASLLSFDCLPCLMDAALSTSSPENEMIFSWQNRITAQRREAEKKLSGDPMQWVKLWNGKNQSVLHEVPPNTDEYNAVFRLFHATPTEPCNYQAGLGPSWSQTSIDKIERVQNSPLMQGFQTYYKKLAALFQEAGIEFVPNVHTRWIFHGTDAIEAIVSDPLTGFQPLVSGSRLGTLWGAGTYFARDARYVVESGFSHPGKDGKQKMLLCLVATGIPCLGDSTHKGILPYRNGRPPYKYNSSVDSLASPEIFIIQEPSAAYPAYTITLK